MKPKTLSLTLAVLALAVVPALAQDGLATNPTSPANTIPAPGTATPSDPAANSNPAARVPTSADEAREVLRQAYPVGIGIID